MSNACDTHMLQYIALFLLVTTIPAISFDVNGRRVLFLLIAGMILSCVVGFRAEGVGIDTPTYYSLYEQVNEGYKDTWLEGYLGIFFIYLSVFSNSIGLDAPFLIFIYALLTILFTLVTVYRYSNHYSISIAVFLSGLGMFFFMHNVMRQALAISIVFYSLHFICRREQFRFFIAILAAYVVHSTALVFLPFYYLARFKFTIRVLFCFWFVSFIFVFNTDLIISCLNALSFMVPHNYADYLADEKMYRMGGVSGFGLVFLLKQFMFPVFMAAYRKNSALLCKRSVYLFSMFYIILVNVTLGLGLIARMIDYLGIFLILSIPMSVNDLVRKDQRCFVFILIWCLLFVIYLRDVFVDGHSVFSAM